MNRKGRFILLAATVLIALPLVAQAQATSTPFTVRWTAPGDDSLSGKATAYELRYAIWPLTAANYHTGKKFTGLPVPKNPGSPESFVVSGLPNNYKHYLAMKTVDNAGNWSKMSNVLIHAAAVTGVEDDSLESAPEYVITFSEPRPNPARSQASWAFALPRAAEVQVDVFDVRGRHVQNLASGVRSPGNGEISWDLRDHHGQTVDAGVYFVKARFDHLSWTKRLVVIR